jgi:uncharacterized membrane protein YraQ (UPF0718 family)
VGANGVVDVAAAAAIAAIRKTEEIVSGFTGLLISILMMMVISEFTAGCLTGPGRRLV